MKLIKIDGIVYVRKWRKLYYLTQDADGKVFMIRVKEAKL